MKRSALSLAGAAMLVALVSVRVSPAEAGVDPGVTCAIVKLKAATKKLTAKAKCHMKAYKKNVAVDPECLAKAEEKFDQTFAKIEDKGGCVSSSTSDAAYVESVVDGALASLLAAIPTGVTTPTPTPTATPALVSCDVLAQDCSLTTDGCYLMPDCSGSCLGAGSGVQGQGCTQADDCAPGYDCFSTSSSGSQCLKFCTSTTECLLVSSGSSCVAISGCSGLGACF